MGFFLKKLETWELREKPVIARVIHRSGKGFLPLEKTEMSTNQSRYLFVRNGESSDIAYAL